MSAEFPARRLAKAIVRQLRLSRQSRVLEVGCGDGDVVGQLRRMKRHAYGLFEGPPPQCQEGADVPMLQPATLHQSLPFPAQSFDAVVVRQSADYDGSLDTPEACTATANLLAGLKPGGQFVYAGSGDFSAMRQHLNQFPGKGSQLMLGTGGIVYFVLRLCGLARPGLAALRYIVPHEPISRLEWHRLARKAVTNLRQSSDDGRRSSSDVAAGSPAA